MSVGVLSGRRVMIDPGHGGRFPGAVGPAGTQEKDVVLAVSKVLQADLVELGAEVRMTRSTDVEVAPGASLRDDLKARVDLANDWPADLLISVHANSAENASAKGTETFHAIKASDRSKTLAKLLQKSMIDDIGLTDCGVKASNFYVIKNTKMPATLVELGFISNPGEEQILADPAMQTRFGHSLSKGVADYFAVEAHVKPDGPSELPGDEGDLLAPGDPVEMLLIGQV
ncbi:MAG: N-acetylmuramoyl-L-alanine amidase [Candidatus Eremiobacteraeota bacterium]|nr:N-acetylmuramoyl-L-alanine amidase [Candidatus Eremiobacteraeota bacterium]